MSSFDLERLLSHERREIDRSISYLRNQGLIKTVEADGITHYCSSHELKRLRKKIREIALDDGVESEIVQIVRELLQQLYPSALKTKRAYAAGLHGNRHFDIVLEFKEPVMSIRFVIANVYSKIPVTKYIVQSFIRKIRLTRNVTKFSGNEARNPCYRLRGKALGMIVCNNARTRSSRCCPRTQYLIAAF